MNANPFGLANGRTFNETIDRNLKNTLFDPVQPGMQHEFPAGFLLKMNYAAAWAARLMGQATPNSSSTSRIRLGQTMGQAMRQPDHLAAQQPQPSRQRPHPAVVLKTCCIRQTAVWGGHVQHGLIAADLAPYPARGDFADTMWLLSAYGLQP